MKNQKGFTLIELMIVIAILGILAAVALPKFSSYKAKSHDVKSVTALNTTRLGQEAKYIDDEEYATCDQASCSSVLPGFSVSDGISLSTAPQTNAEQFTINSSHSKGTLVYKYDSAAPGVTKTKK